MSPGAIALMEIINRRKAGVQMGRSYARWSLTPHKRGHVTRPSTARGVLFFWGHGGWYSRPQGMGGRV